MQIEIKDLIGLTFTSVEGRKHDRSICLKTDTHSYKMKVPKDCCNSGWVEDICGDLNDLIDSIILQAEERTSKRGAKQNDGPDNYEESTTWTYYVLGTKNGDVTIRFCGRSNGYYAEKAEIYKEERKK